MKRLFLTTVLLIATIGSVMADEISFVTSAPRSVVANQHFKISYKVNRAKVGEPTIPEIEGFRILSGPHRSTQRSMQMINGETTSSESVTFTYILIADKEGEYTIPAATVVADGEKITSNEAKIRVLPEDQASQASSQNSGNSRVMPSRSNSTNIANDDLFIRASLSKTKVYEQEAIFMKQTLNHINEVGDDVWRYVVAMRSEMFDSVHKYLYKTIRKYSYTKQQNKKRMNELEEKHKDLITK